MPIPYVDASSASAFPEKYRRVIVGAAGMVVELFVASIALFFWLELEPGWLRAVLFNVMLIAGISTVLFNANPLLRFDGYYMLADLIEIPNLRARGAQYLQSVFERRLFGLKVPAPEFGARERAWLVFFTIASFIYRLFITFAIALFIAGQYFIIGVVLAIFAVVMAIVLPLVKAVAYLALHPRLRRHRLRAAAVSGAMAGALVLLVFGVPVPAWTNAEGVIWVPEQSVVRAGANGFVARVVAQPGSQVHQGDALIETVDPMLPLNIRALEAQKQELQARYQAERIESLVQAQITLEQLKSVDADLDRARERATELIVRSPADGVFVVPAPQDLPDRFLKQGEQIGYVLTSATATARVLVPQESVDMVRKDTEGVRVKLAERLMDTLPATIRRELPGASDRLPSMALAQAGGGKVALDPSQGDVPKMLQTHFEFELELPAVRPVGIGGRVYVRFEHQAQTIAAQVYRSLRQLFLERFAI